MYFVDVNSNYGWIRDSDHECWPECLQRYLDLKNNGYHVRVGGENVLETQHWHIFCEYDPNEDPLNGYPDEFFEELPVDWQQEGF